MCTYIFNRFIGQVSVSPIQSPLVVVSPSLLSFLPYPLMPLPASLFSFRSPVFYATPLRAGLPRTLVALELAKV